MPKQAGRFGFSGDTYLKNTKNNFNSTNFYYIVSYHDSIDTCFAFVETKFLTLFSSV
jgi:hypothetical protein